MQTSDRSDPGYSISTDKTLLDIPLIHRYLSHSSYWAQGRSFEVVTRTIEHSLCFGVFAVDGKQVGFARVVTDYTTFGWLCDVFIIDEHQGRALGKRLVEAVTRHTDLQGIKRLLLATKDAHGLYRGYGGFSELFDPARWMERLHHG